MGQTATEQTVVEEPRAALDPAAPTPAAPKRPGRLREWLWRSRALAEARSALRELPEVQRQRLQRARVAAELAERALDPIDPLRAGSSVALALSLYREAAYWALLAQSRSIEAPDLAAAFASTPRDVLLFAAASAEGLREVRAALVERSFVESSADTIEEQRRQARAAKAFVDALIQLQAGPELTIQRVLFERWLRVSLIGFVLLATTSIGVSTLRAVTLSPNLAEGKRWRTSSTHAACKPAENECAGTRTDILFHTNDEKEPWFEIDLGTSQRFSVVEVKNRDDCCPDRAIPLVIEVSSDREKWTEVARQKESFRFWRAEFAPRAARYVRARVARRSILHLDGVAVRAQ